MARALRAYKVMFLTDVEGWLRRPGRPGVAIVSETTADEVEAALGGIEGGMRPKLAGLRRRDPRRRDVRAHRRRPRAALAAARAVHRRGHRHEDPGGAVDLRRATSTANYARYPVEFVRGEGARAVGRRGQRVPRLPGRHRRQQRRALPPGGRRGDPRAGRAAACTSPTSSTPSRWCASPSALAGARRSAAGVFFTQLRAPRPSRPRSSSRASTAAAATSSSVHGGLPRPHLRRAVGHAAGDQAGAVRAAGPRLPRRRADRRGARGGRRRAHRRRAPRAGAGRGRRPRAGRRRPAARRARPATRPGRR